MYEYAEHKDYEKLFNIHNLNAQNQKKTEMLITIEYLIIQEHEQNQINLPIK